MGREIRRVIPNWEHPRQDCKHSPWQGGCDEAKANNGKCLRPLYDEDYDTAAQEWLKANAAWESGKDPDRLRRLLPRRKSWLTVLSPTVITGISIGKKVGGHGRMQRRSLGVGLQYQWSSTTRSKASR